MHPTRKHLAALLVSLSTACSSGGGDKSVGPKPTAGGFTIAASATTVSVAQGAIATLTVIVTRTGNFNGAVALSVNGLPSGVTGTFQPPQIGAGQTSSTLSITANAAAAAATLPITVTGSASGVSDQTVAASLAITAVAQGGPFTLSLSVTSFLVLPPTALYWLPVLKIRRNAGFTGPVALNVMGLPPTLAVVMPPSVAGDSTPLIILNIGAPTGTYTATIRGNVAGQGERLVSLQLVVAPPSTGSVQWTFCPNGIRTPIWFFAVKDGSGPWARIAPSADGLKYAFNVSQRTAAVAMVTTDSGTGRTSVYQYTAQEIAAAGAAECGLYPGATSRTATGQVAPLAGGGLTSIGMSGWLGSTGGSGGPYQMENLPPGPLDLVAFSEGVGNVGQTVVNRGIIRRGVNPPSGGMNALLDFSATEAFTMTSPTLTFGNTNGELFSVIQRFASAGGTDAVLGAVLDIDRAPAARTVYGIPNGQTIADDLHEVIATIGTLLPARPTRQVIAYSRTLTARALNFGPPLPAPVVTVAVAAAAPVARLRAQGTLPPEYSAGVAFEVKSTGPQARFATLLTTQGFLGGSATYDVQMPDLTGVLGWDSAWTMRAGDPTNWWVSGGGPILDLTDARDIFQSTQARWTAATTGIAPPTDGGTYLMARASGTITPAAFAARSLPPR